MAAPLQERNSEITALEGWGFQSLTLMLMMTKSMIELMMH